MSVTVNKLFLCSKLSKYAKDPKTINIRDVGYELYSSQDINILPNSRALVKTDLKFTFPFGYYGLIVSLPELAIKSIDNSSSVIENEIDAIEILVINNSNDVFTVNIGDKIAIMIVNKYYDYYIFMHKSEFQQNLYKILYFI